MVQHCHTAAPGGREMTHRGLVAHCEFVTSPIATATATLQHQPRRHQDALFGNHAPKTVANFRRPGPGHQGVLDAERVGQHRRTLLRRCGVPPRHRRLHDPGRRPDRHRPRRTGYKFADEFHGELQFDKPYCWPWPTPGRAPTARSSFITVGPNPAPEPFGTPSSVRSSTRSRRRSSTPSPPPPVDRNDRPHRAGRDRVGHHLLISRRCALTDPRSRRR